MGKATAIYLAKHGYTVYGAARRVEKMQDLIPHGIRPIELDPSHEASITACVNQIFKAEKHIDILVNLVLAKTKETREKRMKVIKEGLMLL